MKLRVMVISCLGVIGCNTSTVADQSHRDVVERTPAEMAFAKQTLEALQEVSFRKGREYCGYIGIDSAGNYLASVPTSGHQASCLSKRLPRDFRVLASYHTHGAHSDEFESEVPSLEDVLSDVDEGIDGYIATPGGRFWHVSLKTETAVMVCGEGCLSVDPDYARPTDYKIRKTYSIAELEATYE